MRKKLMKIKLYIDIDGVILTKKHNLPKGVNEFIRFITTNYDCYWLTTHCRNGENKTIKYLSEFFLEEQLFMLRKIKATNWDDLKTNAINLNSNFLWIDDNPFVSEIKALKLGGKSKNLIKVDLNREDELEVVMKKILNFEKEINDVSIRN